jgi:FkbM family methyltransferase
MMMSIRPLARAVIPRSMRNWIRAPGASLSWLFSDVRARLGLLTSYEPRRGWRFKSHPGAIRFAYRAQEEDPEQVSEFNQFIQLCSPGMRLFDLGCHFGLFSLAAVRFGGRDAGAIAVDPSPAAIRMVRFQCGINGLDDRVKTLRACVTDRRGTMHCVDAGVQSAGYFVSPEAGHEDADLTEVDTVSVDDLTERFGPPTHLKIDVEGHEISVLKGAERTLTQHRPLVFLELHGDILRRGGETPKEVISHLAMRGYSLREVDGSPLADSAAERSLTRLLAIPSEGTVPCP